MAKPKEIAGINCEGPARAGIVLGLSGRLDEMCALRDFALDFSNPDGVHDMRVASRRLRGALTAFMPHLKCRQLAGRLAEIKTIASALGRVRDHDVAIITLTDTAARAPAVIAAGIRRFADLRRAALEEARKDLVTALDPEGLLLLQRKFNEALDHDKPQPRASQKRSAAPLPLYRDVAADIILKRLEDLEMSSSSLYRPLKSRGLHNLRIKAKHLRYALQLFAPCWGEPMLLFANKVAGLQSSLGNLHDCDVWVKDFGKVATAEADPDFDNQGTAVWLLRHFAKLRARHFGNALSQWHEWETGQFSVHLRACIQPDVQTSGTFAK